MSFSKKFFIGTALAVLGAVWIVSSASAQTLQSIKFVPQTTGPTCSAANRGNLFYSSTTGQLFLCDGASNVAIEGGSQSTTTTSGPLNAGYVTAGTFGSLSTAGNYAFDTNTFYVDATNHRIGIGTTSPSTKLHLVNGILAITGSDAANSISIDNPVNSSANVGLSWKGSLGRIRYGGSGAGSAAGFAIQGVGDATKLYVADNGGISVGYSTTTPPTDGAIIGGNVAIGFNSTTYKLAVNGTARIGDSNGGNNYGIILTPSDTNSWVWMGNISGNLQIGTGGTIATTPLVTVTSAGRLGIKTTAPGNLVVAQGTNDGIFIQSASTTARYAGVVAGTNKTGVIFRNDGTGHRGIRSDGSDFEFMNAGPSGANPDIWSTVYMKIASSGQVGIGLDNPTVKLQVADSGVGKDITTGVNGGISIQSNTGGRTTSTGAQIEFVLPANSDGSNPWGQGRILTVAANTTTGNATGKMIIGTRRYINKIGTGTTWYYGDDLIVDGSGRVGINTLNPAYTLDVTGSAHVSGDLTVDGTLSGVTVNAAYVSAGTFGSSVSGGSYRFNATSTNPLLYIDATNGRVGVNTATPATGKFVINTETSIVNAAAGGITNGTFVFGNGSTANTSPLMMARSDNATGLSILSATADANTYADMAFNVRETDSTDFATTANKTAFQFTRYTTELMSIDRTGIVRIPYSIPLVFESVGTGNYNVSAFYHQSSTVVGVGGFRIDVARATDSSSGTILPFSVTARGGTRLIDVASSLATGGSGVTFAVGGGAGVVSAGSGTFSGTVTVNKLNASEVDPPYTIGGKKYATYMAGMTGLKEETTGVVALKNKTYVLDLANAEEGSDLWMFFKTANLAKEGLKNVVLLTTPNFDGKVWYEKSDGKIVIHGDADGEVSYRLTAPRFDAAMKDGNRRSDTDYHSPFDPEAGLNLDVLLR